MWNMHLRSRSHIPTPNTLRSVPKDHLGHPSPSSRTNPHPAQPAKQHTDNSLSAEAATAAHES